MEQIIGQGNFRKIQIFMAQLKRIIGFSHTLQIAKLFFQQIQHLADLKHHIRFKYQNSLIEQLNTFTQN